MTTQLAAQAAVAATIATQAGQLSPGTSVSLLWARSYLPEPGAPLVHEYECRGFDAQGRYVAETATLDMLDDVVTVPGLL